LSNDTVNKAVELVVAGVPGNLVWLGDGINNGWDNAGSYQSWTNTGTLSLDYFYDGDNATFNNIGSGSPAINLTTVNSPGSLTVNATQNYDLTGSGGIAGVTSLNKSGSGTLILETANSYSGPTIINNGTVQIGNANASGSLGTGAVTNNGMLTFNRTDGISVANDLHGTGSVIYNGTGSVTPTSVNNDYTGSTVVNNGILYATTSAAFGQSSGTTVNSGGQVYITANMNIGAEPLVLAGVGDGNGALRKGGAGATTFGGALTLFSNTTIVVDSGATLTLTNVSGIAGASNALTIVGGGTLTLGGLVSLGTNALTASIATLNLNSTNFYSGGTTLTAGIVNVNTNGALGSGPVTATSTGRFVIGTGLNITNFFTATTVNPGAATGFLMVNDNTNNTVTTISGPIVFDNIAVSGGHFAGPTSSGYLNVPGSITMPASTPMVIRLGNLRFSGGGGSYYTEIQPRANTTSIGANNGIATNAVMDLAGNGTAYFDLNGFSQRLAGLKNTVTPANAALGFVTNSSATAGTLTLDLGTGNYFSFGGHIVGNQSLVMASGQQVLTGTNNYTGNTTVNGGTLELGLPTLSTNSTVSVTNGATLQLDYSVTNTVAAFVSNGVSQVAGVYSAATSSPYITGSGYLLVPSSGPTLPGIITNSLSGNTLNLTWPAGQGWRLIGQTNSLSVGLSTNWGTVTGGSDGSISITIDPNQLAVFYRLVYP
jgi:autotransporter-associated beta strand protein